MEGNEVVKTKKSRAKYEIVIILLVVVAAVVIAFGIFHTQQKAERGKLLLSELDQIRTAVTTYVTLNKGNPPDLTSLTKMTYSFGPNDTTRQYLSNIKVGKGSQLVDPFGQPYKYDPKTGWVSSATEGYSNW